MLLYLSLVLLLPRLALVDFSCFQVLKVSIQLLLREKKHIYAFVCHNMVLNRISVHYYKVKGEDPGKAWMNQDLDGKTGRGRCQVRVYGTVKTPRQLKGEEDCSRGGPLIVFASKPMNAGPLLPKTIWHLPWGNWVNQLC